MRTFQLPFFAFLMIATLLLLGCENEPLDIGLEDGLPDLELGTISFKIDGKYMEFDAAAMYTDLKGNLNDEPEEGLKGWQITAFDENETIRLGIQLFPADLEKGNFDLENEEEMNVVQYISEVNEESHQSDIYISFSGEVEITDLNTDSKKINGKFNAKASLLIGEEEVLEITEGKINNVQYLEAGDFFN